jgi:hypothetical protein
MVEQARADKRAGALRDLRGHDHGPQELMVKSSLQYGITILSSLFDHFFENVEKHRIMCFLDVALAPET